MLGLGRFIVYIIWREMGGGEMGRVVRIRIERGMVFVDGVGR